MPFGIINDVTDGGRDVAVCCVYMTETGKGPDCDVRNDRGVVVGLSAKRKGKS